MRICLVTSIFPPEIGGPSLQTKLVAESLADRGHDVCVVTYESDSPRHISSLPYKLRELQIRQGEGWAGKLRRQLSIFHQLTKFVREFQPDVLHSQVFGSPLSWIVGIVGRMLGIPSLVKITASFSAERRLHKQVLSNDDIDIIRAFSTRYFAKDALCSRLFTGSWVTTPFFARHLETDLRQSPGRIHLIPNFTDLSLYRREESDSSVRSEDDSPTTILTVARMAPQKELETCLHALALMNDEPVEWWFIGSGKDAYRRKVMHLAKRLGVQEQAHFPGPIPPEQLPSHYHDADIFVLSSRLEPFGIVLLEAMAAELPIVATNVGGIPFVTDNGRCAQLVPPGKPKRLRDAIATLLSSPKKRETLLEASRTQVQKFDLSAGVGALIDVYEELSFSHSQNTSGISSDRLRSPRS